MVRSILNSIINFNKMNNQAELGINSNVSPKVVEKANDFNKLRKKYKSRGIILTQDAYFEAYKQICSGKITLIDFERTLSREYDEYQFEVHKEEFAKYYSDSKMSDLTKGFRLGTLNYKSVKTAFNAFVVKKRLLEVQVQTLQIIVSEPVIKALGNSLKLHPTDPKESIKSVLPSYLKLKGIQNYNLADYEDVINGEISLIEKLSPKNYLILLSIRNLRWRGNLRRAYLNSSLTENTYTQIQEFLRQDKGLISTTDKFSVTYKPATKPTHLLLLVNERDKSILESECDFKEVVSKSVSFSLKEKTNACRILLKEKFAINYSYISFLEVKYN
jgi:hypothetical protein